MNKEGTLHKYKYKYHLILVLGILPFIYHLAFYYSLPLNPDEAYYWSMSQELAWSYYHHTLMVAWLLAPLNYVVQFFGEITALDIRIYNTLMFMLTGIILTYLLAQIVKNDIAPAYKLKQEQQHRILLIFAYSFLLSPLVLLGGTIWTHDTPLALFLSLTLLTYYNAYRIGLPTKSNYGKYLMLWGLCGLAFGLSILSKYTAVLWGGAAVLYMLFSSQGRKHLLHSGPWFAVLIVLICSLPILIWNASNDWVSLGYRFTHLTADAQKEFEWSPNLGLTLGGLVLTLGIAALFIVGRGFLQERGKVNCRINWLLWQTLFPLGFFVVASAINEVYFNWMGFSLLLWLMLLAIYAGIKYNSAWVYGHYVWQILVSSILFYLVYADHPSLNKKFLDYEDMAGHLSALEVAYPGAYLFGTSYPTHAILSWSKKELLPYSFIDGYNNNYDYLSGKIPPGQDVLLFSYNSNEGAFAKYFDEFTPLDPIELTYLGNSRTVIYTFLGTNNQFEKFAQEQNN